jgi:hypothetical protein
VYIIQRASGPSISDPILLSIKAFLEIFEKAHPKALLIFIKAPNHFLIIIL